VKPGDALPSCLARVVPNSPTSRAEIEALRQRAWIEKGIVVLHPDEISDEWLRQGLRNEATKRFGRRMKR
jgi:hypothetical protein